MQSGLNRRYVLAPPAGIVLIAKVYLRQALRQTIVLAVANLSLHNRGSLGGGVERQPGKIA